MLFPPVSDDPCFSISVRSGYRNLRAAWITTVRRLTRCVLTDTYRKTGTAAVNFLQQSLCIHWLSMKVYAAAGALFFAAAFWNTNTTAQITIPAISVTRPLSIRR